ncbi:hypothetical protein ACSBR2_005028 [Camellia fascicularis]
MAQDDEANQDDEAKHITREDESCASCHCFPCFPLTSLGNNSRSYFHCRGKVKVVPSGDSLVIIGSTKAEIPPEKTITLSSLLLQDWPVEVVLDVIFKVDYTVPFIGQEFGSVFLGDKNVALMVVSDGWVKLGFYHKTCPSIEAIVKETTAPFISRAPTLAAPLIRMHFHDCFGRIHGPFWVVPLGRRDGRVSIMTEALTGLPPPFGNITLLKTIFASKGLSVKVLAVLSDQNNIVVYFWKILNHVDGIFDGT